MEPTGCGVGGDLFAIVWDPSTKSLHGYNGSGRSAKGLTLDALRDTLKERGLTQIPATGPLPVTVPGCVDGWFALHEKFGVRTMAENLAPAIAYARDGFPVSPVIADAWQRSVARFREMPGFIEQFTVREGGKAAPRGPRAGEVWKNRGLATTYEAIARDGRDGFYSGEVARIIAATVAAQGGFLTEDDLASHAGEWVQPVSSNYRGYDVWELPPNGQGIAALQILNILENFDLGAMGWGTATHVHTFIEAKKLAFEDRARYYADPEFARTPTEHLLSKPYAKARASAISPDRAAMRVEPGSMPTGADTTYLTVADAKGMMVSLIQSNYRGMGSGVVPHELHEGARISLGFMLQNRGEQFALVGDHPNVYAPGKRPFHTIIPAFITKDGEPWISFGLMGGAMQPQGHAQIVSNLIDFGMTLQQAGDVPRVHHDGSTEPQGSVRPMGDGGIVNLEPGFPQRTIDALVRMGHRIQAADVGIFGGYQAIMRDPRTGVYTGATERRKDGNAAGF
jgi:gamma-glutamyltranspeptidase/glutathione hydrolase